MTKKEFKELCYDNVYTGWNGHRIKVNAFYFDYKHGITEDGKIFAGYKHRVSANVKDMSKKELFDFFYGMITKGFNPPYYINYRVAETDEKRFKVSLSL